MCTIRNLSVYHVFLSWTITIWAQTTYKHAFNFTESDKYLRSIGALEKLPGCHPLVRIANYMVGPADTS